MRGYLIVAARGGGCDKGCSAGGLKPRNLCLQFWEPEVQNQFHFPEIEVLAGCPPSGGSRGQRVRRSSGSRLLPAPLQSLPPVGDALCLVLVEELRAVSGLRR